jgi:hypothetical protein
VSNGEVVYQIYPVLTREFFYPKGDWTNLKHLTERENHFDWDQGVTNAKFSCMPK